MGGIAFVFPGQGSQTPGMGKDFYERCKASAMLFDIAESKRPGVKELCFNGPAEVLNETENAQPCLYLSGLASAAALREKGIIPAGCAGFSLGEIPAACLSGLMSFERGFDFVCRRALAMKACTEKNKGAMFAVLKLENRAVEDICERIGNAYAVNYNCPGQLVAACGEEVSGELTAAVKALGGRAVKLPVSGAFHSPFMDEAALEMAEYLRDEAFGNMEIPLYSNKTATVYDNPGKLLSEQINSPVLWQKTIENMAEDGFDTFIEVGAGKTLTGLIKKINPNLRLYNAGSYEDAEKIWESVNA